MGILNLEICMLGHLIWGLGIYMPAYTAHTNMQRCDMIYIARYICYIIISIITQFNRIIIITYCITIYTIRQSMYHCLYLVYCIITITVGIIPLYNHNYYGYNDMRSRYIICSSSLSVNAQYHYCKSLSLRQFGDNIILLSQH